MTSELFLPVDLGGPQMKTHIIRMQGCVDPPLHGLFVRLKERKLIKPSADVQVLMRTFKGIHLGVSSLWAMTGPSIEPALHPLALQIEPFARSIERKSP